MNRKKQWERATKIGDAESFEFQRYIEKKKLLADVRKIQKEASLPLSLQTNKLFIEDPIYIQWMGWNDKDQNRAYEINKRRIKVVDGTNIILDKYKISHHFFGSLFNFIVTGESIHTFQTKGFPKFVRAPFILEEFGDWEYLCIITPETDITNPIVLENIKQWQRRSRAFPPRPIQVGRKKIIAQLGNGISVIQALQWVRLLKLSSSIE